MFPIKSKIIIASTLVFSFMLLCFSYLVYHSSEQAELVKEDARLESHADRLQAEVDQRIRKNQLSSLIELTGSMSEDLSPVRLQLFNPSGRLVFSDSALATSKIPFNRSYLSKLPLIENLSIHGQMYRCLWSVIQLPDRKSYVLQVALPLTQIRKNLEHLRILFAVSIPLAIFATALATYLIIRQAFRPMTAMIGTAQKISATNLDRRLEVPQSKDEVKMLAETLNEMIGRLDSSFQSQRQFIADASHELRTPLTIVNSELEFTLRNAKEDSIREGIEISLSEIDRLTRMVEGLLLLAKIDSDQMPMVIEAVRVDELLVESVRLMGMLAAREKISVDLHIDEAVELKADKDKLRRAIVNVLDNAIRYSNDGGKISVQLEILNGGARKACIIIRDNGIGVSEEDMPKIFDRFYRGEEPRSSSEGSGLGLAITRELVELNCGSIDLSSQVNKGTTVRMEFPIQAEN